MASERALKAAQKILDEQDADVWFPGRAHINFLDLGEMAQIIDRYMAPDPEPIHRCPSCKRRVTAPDLCPDCHTLQLFRRAAAHTCLICEAPLSGDEDDKSLGQTCHTCLAKERAAWDSSEDRKPR